jgi:hypothetical protein
MATKKNAKTNPGVMIAKETLPSWDADLGELRVGDVLIKRYTKPAKNQRIVLTAFQELDWRHKIDDPLTPKPRRRGETIAGLNDDHINPGIIHFRGDGTGKAIIWEWCQ